MRDERKKALLFALPLLVLLELTGCSTVLPADLEGKLLTGGTADDHLAAAIHYQNKGNQLESEAARYEALVGKVGAHEDPKGLRRSGWVIAAQESRTAAKQMHELYAAHFEKAQTMYGKKSPE